MEYSSKVLVTLVSSAGIVPGWASPLLTAADAINSNET
jgi:hypothetical protein